MTELLHFIINSLASYYGIKVTAICLLPVGADINASIYKVEASDQQTYFVKLRRGHGHDVSVAVLNLLQTVGIKQLILPVKTLAGQQIQRAHEYTFIVYPFVEGEDGFSRTLTDEQWVALGTALRRVHEVDVPPSLQAQIRTENFSSKWRDEIRSLYANFGAMPVGDEITLGLWQFLQKNKSLIEALVNCSEELGQKFGKKSLRLVLCHSDIHGGNVLLDKNDQVYIVDWDEPILAPIERDLMFIGGGVGNVWNKPREEELFYRGYGEVDIDVSLLAYYRHERIVEDIAVYGVQLPRLADIPARREMYRHFLAMFAPDGVVDIAIKTEKNRVKI